MQWFNNMKIAAKLITTFCIVLLVIIVLGVFSIVQLGKINYSADQLGKNWLPSVMSLAKVNQKLNEFRRAELQTILADDAANINKYRNLAEQRKSELKGVIDKYYPLISSDKERQIADTFKDLLDKYYVYDEEIITLAVENKDVEAKTKMNGPAKEVLETIFVKVQEDVDLNNNGATDEVQTGEEIYSSAKTLMYVVIAFSIVLVFFLAIWLARKISKPIILVSERLDSLNNVCLTNLQNGAQKFADGDLNIKIVTGTPKLEIDSEDETGKLAKALNGIIDKTQASVHAVEQVTGTVVNMSNEINMLVDSSLKGKLSIRGNSEKFKGGFKEIISGLNNTLDAIIGPLNMAAEYIDRISKGDVPAKITESYNGDFNEIKNNLNVCIDAIKALIDDGHYLAKNAIEGKLSVRADSVKHQGDFRKIISGFNETLDAVIGPLNMAAEYVDRISKGDVPEKITESYNGDFNEIKNNLNVCIDAIKLLIEDSSGLAVAAGEGKLANRADATRHHGDFRKIIQGVNNTLDALINPLNTASDYFERIAEGDIPGKIEDEYRGDFNKIKLNLNTCIDAINLLISDSVSLSESAIKGNFDARSNTSKHFGDYKKIMEGINATLDVVVDKSKWYEAIIDAVPFPIHVIDMNMNWVFLNREFEKLMVAQNIIKDRSQAPGMPCCSATANICNTDSCGIKQLQKGVGVTYFDWHGMSCKQDTSYIINAKGEKVGYVEIVQDLTSMIKISDYTKAEVERMAANLALLAQGNVDLNLKLKEADKHTETVKAEFSLINDNLAKVKESLGNVITDTRMLAQSAVDGKLSVRADASKHLGNFKDIVVGINDTLDSIMAPINEGVAALEKMASGDLTIRIESDYKGDHQLIKNSINSVAGSLNKALEDVSEAVAATASASNQISSSTEEMAAGSQEQTRQTAEVASGVEEMTKTILENTKNASIAADAAKDQGDKAREGGNVVDETITGMNRIAEVVKKSAETVQELGKSSDQIGEIVQVIDDIADQTNLLALNAAIEAARAGEQGRGFAVVADEVRKLAERTTKATKEIATMIKQIQKDTSNAVSSMEEGTNEVERGKALANKAGDSLKKIVEGSQKVLDIVAQVAAASEQQSSTAEEISRNVEAISTVAQESAGGTQQIAHAAEDLSKLTLNLEELVSQFKLSSRQAQRHASEHKKVLSHGANAGYLS